MAKELKHLLVNTLLPAADLLVKKYDGSCLFRIEVVREQGECRIHDVRSADELPRDFTEEERLQVARWLRKERGFRVFMSEKDRAQFMNPCVKLEGGKLVIRSTTPLHFPFIRPMR